MGMGLETIGASLVLAARDRVFQSIGDDAVRAAAGSYRQRMSEFAEMKVLEIWYAQVNVDALLEHFRKDPDMLARLSKKQKQARSQTSEAVVPKLTAVVDGRRQIKDNPPVLYHFQQNVQEFRESHRDHIEQYRKSLQADRLSCSTAIDSRILR